MKSIWREDAPVGTNPFRFFLFSSRPHWRAAVVAIVLAAIADALSASVSYVFKIIANAATALPNGNSYHDLFWGCAAYIFILALAKAFWRVSGFSGAKWAMGAMATARHSLTAYVTLHSRSYFSERFAGSLANKISHAARGMREMVDQLLWQFLELFITAIAGFAIAFTTSPLIAWIFLVWVLVVVAANTYFARKRVPYSTHSHRLETSLNGATVDLLTNISAMQEYARRMYEIDRLKDSIDKRRVAGVVNWHIGEWIRVMNSVLLVIFGSAMVYTAVSFTRTGVVSIGDLILILTIIFRIEGQLQSLGSQINQFTETWGEIKESLEEIIEPHEIPDLPGARARHISSASIDLHNVNFSYAGNSVFKDLTLHIPAGQRMGLVGRSGAGKSTFVRLLMHHHNLDSGSI